MGVFFWRQFTRAERARLGDRRDSIKFSLAHFSCVYASNTYRHESCHDLQQPQKRYVDCSTLPGSALFFNPRRPPPAVHGHVAVCLCRRSFLPPSLILKLTTSNTLLTNSLQTAALNTPPSKKILLQFSTPDNSCRASSSVIAL
jgi:hypothetical protein